MGMLVCICCVVCCLSYLEPCFLVVYTSVYVVIEEEEKKNDGRTTHFMLSDPDLVIITLVD